MIIKKRIFLTNMSRTLLKILLDLVVIIFTVDNICQMNILQISNVRRIADVLWFDEKTFTIEMAQNHQKYQQLVSLMQRNARKKSPNDCFLKKN